MKKNKTYHLFNIKTEEVIPDLSASEAAKIMGIESHHVNTFISNHCICAEVWHVVDADYINVPSKSHTLPVPHAIYNETVTKIKNEYRQRFENALSKAQQEAGKAMYSKLLFLSSTGAILEQFDSYKDAAEHLGIPIGTVKSRTARILIGESPKFINLCKSSDYDEVLKKFY